LGLVVAHGRESVVLKASPWGSLPEGVVTFLLIVVEGSSRRWEREAEAMRAAMSLHDELGRRTAEIAP
jgi:hypothetical protein